MAEKNPFHESALTRADLTPHQVIRCFNRRSTGKVYQVVSEPSRGIAAEVVELKYWSVYKNSWITIRRTLSELGIVPFKEGWDRKTYTLAGTEADLPVTS